MNDMMEVIDHASDARDALELVATLLEHADGDVVLGDGARGALARVMGDAVETMDAVRAALVR